MTLSEFKAWFEGYTEGLEAAPTKAQFDRIKEKVKEIDGAPIIQTVWLDSYRHYYPSYAPHWWQTTSGGYVHQTTATAGLMQNSAQRVGHGAANASMAGRTFDGVTAMYALGKAEAVN